MRNNKLVLAACLAALSTGLYSASATAASTTANASANVITPLAISEDAQKVRSALIEQGLETPLVHNGLSRDDKYEKIRESFANIAFALGLDLTDDSLCETPQRIARMYVDEIFSGLDYARFPKATAIDNKMGVEEMVKVDDISVVSTCEHHFITIDGVASVDDFSLSHDRDRPCSTGASCLHGRCRACLATPEARPARTQENHWREGHRRIFRRARQ